jgi:hypothetical protein
VTWNPLTQPTDRCKIAGVDTPGLCEVTGASSPRKWDEQAGYAMTGAILIYRGNALARFTMRFKLYTLTHWTQWAAIRPLLLRAPVGKRSHALDVDHPVLTEVGISQMVLEDVTAPEQVEDGVWQIELKCIEWRRYSVSVGQADGSEATPEDPRQKKIREVRDANQVKQLALDKGNP